MKKENKKWNPNFKLKVIFLVAAITNPNNTKKTKLPKNDIISSITFSSPQISSKVDVGVKLTLALVVGEA